MFVYVFFYFQSKNCQTFYFFFKLLDTLQWLTDLLYTGRTSVGGIEPNKDILLFFFFLFVFPSGATAANLIVLLCFNGNTGKAI